MTAPLPVIAEEARIAVIQADYALKQALANRAQAARHLHSIGVKRAEIAELLGLTPQRVSKILDGNAPRRPRPAPIGIHNPCAACGAKEGELCRTSSGQRAWRPHRSRLQ